MEKPKTSKMKWSIPQRSDNAKTSKKAQKKNND